ncbi:MAG: hypothetical protein ACR2P0_06700 [Acidimicrobiales bacterium]
MSGAESDLERFADDARRAEAVRERAARADRRVLDGISSTFTGTLLELLESTQPTVLITSAGAQRGVISALGPDVIVLEMGADRRILVRTSAVEGVRHATPIAARETDAIASGPTLAELLDVWADEAPRVVVTSSAGTITAGVLERVGTDQLILRLDGEIDRVTLQLSNVQQVVIG